MHCVCCLCEQTEEVFHMSVRLFVSAHSLRQPVVVGLELESGSCLLPSKVYRNVTGLVKWV